MKQTSNNAAHTAGPWTVKGCNGKPGELYFYVEANGRPLIRGDFCRSEADAALIARAPELLAEVARLREALAAAEGALSRWLDTGNENVRGIVELARSALARAALGVQS